MFVNIPDAVKYIIHELEKEGFEAYVVGGCVRDELRGVTPKDWDIATSALPEQMKAIFKRTYDTGIKHGTITIRIKNRCYEATTYRIDGMYDDMRHPNEVTFTKNITEDLRRRDFTMNAIAYNEKDGFVDPFDGINDIKKQTIRAVMNPSDRFQEDGLRMLRAVRFAAQTNFNMEMGTWEALKENVHLIKGISAERVRDEILKTLMSDYLDRITLLWESGLMGLILTEKDSCVIYKGLNIKSLKSSEKDVLLRLSLLLKDLEREVIEILKGLKFDNKTIKKVNVLVSYIKCNILPNSYSVRKCISETSPEIFFKILKLKNYLGQDIDEIKDIADCAIKFGDCMSLKEMKINGNNIKELGIKDGKDIGMILKYLFDMVLKKPELNDYETLKARAQELLTFK